MNVIIAGSRNVTEYSIVAFAIENSKFEIDNVISGKAKGVDELGEKWAKSRNIPIIEYPADWKKYGKSAGVIRNEQMAKAADALIAIWDGKSSGTFNMIQNAKKYDLKMYIYLVED